MKSDNHVGTHVFELAGLGKAPFRLIGVEYKHYQACAGAPVQPGGNCAYCGTGIIECLVIKSADDRTFIVGSDCVRKTGDAGIIKAFRTSPEYRAKQRDARRRADDRVKEKWTRLMTNQQAREKLAAYIITDWRGNPESWLQMAERIWPKCGASGRKYYLKAAEKIVAVRTNP